MNPLSGLIGSSPAVQAWVSRELKRLDKAIAQNAALMQEFARASDRLATRMVLGGHWNRRG